MPNRQKLVIRSSKDGQYYGVIVGGNGEDMFTGETKPSKQGVKESFKSLRRNLWFAKLVDETSTK